MKALRPWVFGLQIFVSVDAFVLGLHVGDARLIWGPIALLVLGTATFWWDRRRASRV